MPATPMTRGKIALVRPTLSPERHALGAAVKAVKQTESDLAKLVSAQDRARDQRLDLSSVLTDREIILTALRDRETSRARQAFVDGVEDASPLPPAEAAVARRVAPYPRRKTWKPPSRSRSRRQNAGCPIKGMC
jgi:hypothetical protein